MHYTVCCLMKRVRVNSSSLFLVTRDRFVCYGGALSQTWVCRGVWSRPGITAELDLWSSLMRVMVTSSLTCFTAEKSLDVQISLY